MPTLEVLSTCDFAQALPDGKLNAMGIFSRFNFASFPATALALNFAFRVRFESGEEGQHRFRIAGVDPDGRPVGAQIEQPFVVNASDDGLHNWLSGSAQIQNIRFAAPGMYRFDLSIDGATIGNSWLYVNAI
jgi:hypothetical protein